MANELVLHQQERTRASYVRKDFLGDVLYHGFYHREFQINFAKPGRTKTSVLDETALFLLGQGWIEPTDLSRYYEYIASLFTLETISDFDGFSVETLYSFLQKVREGIFGKELLSRAFLALAEKSVPLSFEGALDQRERITALCREKGTLLVALTEGELFATAKEVLSHWSGEGKKIVLIASETGESALPEKEVLSALFSDFSFSFAVLREGGLVYDTAQTEIPLADTALLVFGESGLIDCRSLLLPAGVYAKPHGYFASALAGQSGICRPVAVFVPIGYSMLPAVPITAPSRLHYLLLSKLEAKFGDEVYSLSLEELYGRYPTDFFSVYETSPDEKGAVIPAFSPPSVEKRNLKEYDALREQAISEHLEKNPDCTYFSRLFTEEETEGIKGKILVHGVKVKGTSAEVIPCGKQLPLREAMRERRGTALLSNFLFFLTPKLATLYNDLRRDRAEEQTRVDAGHIDYLLEVRDGKRMETFPLFCKTCIAETASGKHLFFRFRLGGGAVRLGDMTLSWKKEDVDPAEGAPLSPVCIYTPYCSLADENADRETYRKVVGAGRFNLVVLQNRIAVLREGDVILPGMGVVISLEKKLGKELCKQWGCSPLAKGYYSAEQAFFELRLDPPEGIEREEWDTVRWAYGGGLSLVVKGEGLTDGENMERWFHEDGWTSPLSRQTQESTLHSLVKHPRTAVGMTEGGELVVLVFSGRTSRSDGADYGEMIRIARILVPDICHLMNVDGGGSSVFGMVYDGTFTELSLPSTSTGSTVGQVRPINTAFLIPIKERKKD